MKLTKIVATIGPSCEDEKMIAKLILKGTNIFRFNFKHNTTSWHQNMIERVRKVSNDLNLPVGTLVDLQGPEIRLRVLNETLNIEKNKQYTFGKINDNVQISISHPEILKYIKDGQEISADDGAFRFVVKIKDGKRYLTSSSYGILKDKKGLNIPGNDFPVSLLVDRDIEGIELAEKYKIDFVALSFVRTAQDIKFLRNQLNKLKSKSKIVAKIETQKAIENLKEIVEVADIIMVARGDLGVEFPFEQVPYHQKRIIKECLKQGKPVITATQMLESMIQNPFPTRAEISDIANATFDLTDAVMLSAESAIGSYPSKAVATMSRAVSFSENISTEDIRLRHDYDIHDQTELLCDAAYNLYFTSKDVNQLAGFVVFTQSGRTARTISRYRPQIPIYAFAPTKITASSLSINFGVYPFLFEHALSNKEVARREVRRGIEFLKNNNFLKKGQKVIVMYGDHWGVTGGISTVKIVTV